MMKRRSGKFYFKNEQQVMKSLGLQQTPGSGNGWVSKEDGENDNVICQLKSTDKLGITIKKKDLDALNYHAALSSKLPMFAIQFLESEEVYLMIKPSDLQEIAKYVETGEYERRPGMLEQLGIDPNQLKREDAESYSKRKGISQSEVKRKSFLQQYDDQFKKKSKSAL